MGVVMGLRLLVWMVFGRRNVISVGMDEVKYL